MQAHRLRKPIPLFIRHQSRQVSNTSHPWLEMVKEGLLPHLENSHFRVSDLASELHYSERQFYRKIKKLSGMTANNFVRNVKLEKARELLLSGKYQTLKQVAYEVGYLRVDYFSNLFEEKYNQRPIELLDQF